jgi:hypothetical protein
LCYQYVEYGRFFVQQTRAVITVDTIPRWFVILSGVIALLLWLVSFIVSLLRKDYKADPIIGYIAAVIVSSCFTRGALKVFLERWGKRGADEDEDDAGPVPQPHESPRDRKRPKYPPW